MRVIIFNPSSIDSTIAAAILSSFTGIETYAVGRPLSPFTNFIYFFWVGVKPSEEFLNTHKGSHIGFYGDIDIPSYMHKKMTLHTPTAFQDGEYVIPAVYSLIWSITDWIYESLSTKNEVESYKKLTLEKHLSQIRALSLAVEDFEIKNQRVSLTTQAVVWASYTASLINLTLDSTELITKTLIYPEDYARTKVNNFFKYKEDKYSYKEELKNPLVVDYLRHLKMVKYRIEKTITIANIPVSGHRDDLAVPIFSVEMELMPWVIRLARLRYSTVVCSEVCNGRTIHSISSTEALVVEWIKKFINKPSVGYVDIYEG